MGLWDRRTGRQFEEYVLTGRRNGTVLVTSGLLATVLGASATMGVIQLAWQVGFPAFWWLGVGAIGFVIQSIFLSKKLFQFKVFTLPELTQVLLGKEAQLALAIMIGVGWLGVIAAQFVAAAKIVQVLSGFSWEVSLIWVVAVIYTYTALGGNSVIVKTDLLQLIVLTVSVVLCLGYLLTVHPIPLQNLKPVFVNESFGFSKWFYFFIIVGAGYVICPILYTRVFAAKSVQVAKRSLFLSAGGLVLLSACIVGIGIWAQSYLPYLNGQDIFALIVERWLPPWLGFFLIIGLLSAVISSADACLIVIAMILEKDILKKQRVKGVRWMMFVASLVAFGLAGWKQEILPLLLIAYAIFSAGAAPPLSVALFGNRKLLPERKKMVLLALSIGGVMGLIGSLMEKDMFVLAGFFISLSISLWAFYGKETV